MKRLFLALVVLIACSGSSLVLTVATNNVSLNGACIGASPCAATSLTDSLLNQWTVSGGIIYLAPGGANKAATASSNVTLLLYYTGVIYQENQAGNWYYWNNAWIQTTGDPRHSVPIGIAGVAISANTFINTANSSPILIAGANVSGMEGHQGSWTLIAQITSAQWASIASKWGINMIRLPLNSAYWLNHTVYDDPAQAGGGSCCYTSLGGGAYTPDPTGTYQSALQTIVTNITAAGLIADLDLHWDAPKNNAGYAIAPIGQPSYAGGDYAPQFWTQVASAFKNNPLVTFEIFNEPFGSNVYANWVTGTATPGPDAITMVNGGTFANFLMQDNANNNAIFTLQGCNPCNVAGMKSLVTTIRATGATNVILGSPIGYAGELETWLASYTGSGDPDPIGQFGAAWHVYGYAKGVGYPTAVLAANYPIAITETEGFDNVFDGNKSTNGYTWAATNHVPVDLWAWATWSSGGATSGTALTNYWIANAPWALYSATAPTGNSFGAQPIGGTSTVPPQAAAVGYDTQTFNSVVYNPVNSSGQLVAPGTGPWFPANYYGINPVTGAGTVTQNADGSLTVTGPNYSTGSQSIATIWTGTGTNNWKGIAFGGGAYFEAVMSWPNQTNQTFANGGPTWWMLDVEHTSQGLNYRTGWPTGTTPAWNSTTTYARAAIVSYGNQCWISTQNSNKGNTPPPANTQLNNAYWALYNDFFEIDMMEWDVGQGTAAEYAYQFGIGNWYGNSQYLSGPTSTSNPVQQINGSAGSLLVPTGTNFNIPHKYGALWVPATPTTQGYLQPYFDGTALGPRFYWNYYDWNSPNTYPNFPPVNGSTAISGMDFRHMFLMLGTEPAHPITVYSVGVWQANANNNITQ